MNQFIKYVDSVRVNFKPKRKDVIFWLLGLNLLFSFIAVFKSPTHSAGKVVYTRNSSKEIGLLASNISDVQKNLSVLQKEIVGNKPNADFERLESGLKQLASKVNHIGNTNELKIKALISEGNAEINSKLGSISKNVASIKSKDGKAYLPIKDLPFKVVAIDNVQEQGVIDVLYSNKNVALEKGDKLAGWVVRDVDYGHQQAVFQNRANQFVKVSLEQGEV